MHVAIVGAGLSGLTAARRLQDSGHTVVLLDKGRSPGGRLATRRIGGATLDHGAQFFTVRGDELADAVHSWAAAGVVDVWCRGFDETPDGHARYRATGGMSALAKHLARGLDVRCAAMAFAVRAESTGWAVGLDDGTDVRADALVLTCPVPQAGSLLVTSPIVLPAAISSIDYDRTLALLAVLDAPSALGPPGAVQRPAATSPVPLSFVADNAQKGLSAVPALTVHADARWSEEHWDDDPADVLDELTGAVEPFLGSARIVERQLKRWRFATPRTPHPERCWSADEPSGGHAPLVLAGDAFGGPTFEGAFLSGCAAAEAVETSALRRDR